MKREAKYIKEQFTRNGISFTRTERVSEGGSVHWEFYNSGWGEHGWLPVEGNSGGEVPTPQQLEEEYQQQFSN